MPGMPEPGNLVIYDGYYAIYLGGNDVFAANGCRFVLEPGEVEQLEVLPIYAARGVSTKLTARASFHELLLKEPEPLANWRYLARTPLAAMWILSGLLQAKPDTPRIAGNVQCEICGHVLHDHPSYPQEPSLTVRCNGGLVKL
jgi:hypothetical protein